MGLVCVVLVVSSVCIVIFGIVCNECSVMFMCRLGDLCVCSVLSRCMQLDILVWLKWCWCLLSVWLLKLLVMYSIGNRVSVMFVFFVVLISVSDIVLCWVYGVLLFWWCMQWNLYICVQLVLSIFIQSWVVIVCSDFGLSVVVKWYIVLCQVQKLLLFGLCCLARLVMVCWNVCECRFGMFGSIQWLSVLLVLLCVVDVRCLLFFIVRDRLFCQV